MIQFFRKIRRSLLAEGKTGKYLKYALGEIILVVIGIIIALQINNWNEERKTNQKQIVFLKEFKVSIENDLRNYDLQYGPRLLRKKSGLDSLMTYIHNKNEISDSLFIKFYKQLGQGIRLGYDNGPYDALKSSGLDFIKNDSLRTAINRTYTVLPFFQFFSHSMEDEYDSRIADLEYKILDHKPILNKDGTKAIDFKLKVTNIMSNQDFLWIYDLEQQKYYTYIFRMGQMKAALLDLKEKIEIELTK